VNRQKREYKDNGTKGKTGMISTAIPTQTSKEWDELKTRLKATWMTGDYDHFSRFMEKDAEQFFRRLGVAPGTQLLDVGCGAGQLALIAARASAQVTGCDIATNWLDKARARAAAEGLKVTFEEGDAESLPYPDAGFDVVVSLVGAMFAPRPDLVAAELTRVCRPGGMIAMANWTPTGFIGQMFRAISKHIAPSGMPAPVLWGDAASVRDRLREGIADLKLTRRLYRFDIRSRRMRSWSSTALTTVPCRALLPLSTGAARKNCALILPICGPLTTAPLAVPQKLMPNTWR
jgi:2-polyprenyl-3-methyl-5-hydroxy-6-metoxy-1,4-benzoquinol methylase